MKDFAKVRMDGVWKKWEEVERVLGGSESWERKKDKEEEGVIGGKEREEEGERYRISSEPRRE